MATITSLNREFKVVFQPKNREEFGGKRRFGIGACSLAKYVGEHNAETAIRRAIEAGADKFRVKLRTHGIIDFYAH